MKHENVLLFFLFALVLFLLFEKLISYINCAWKLNVTVWDHHGQRHSVIYDRFMVGPPPRYPLTVVGYQPLALSQSTMMKDSLSKAENASFTTYDVDQVREEKDEWNFLSNLFKTFSKTMYILLIILYNPSLG